MGLMEKANVTLVEEFLLLGLSLPSEQQHRLSMLFLGMYLVTVLGNTLIILAIAFDPRLHSPMYFFLSILAFVDICFTSTTMPQMVIHTLTGSRAISFGRCLTQLFFFLSFANLDSMLLCAMAYDRYVAICHPLHYNSIMTLRLCLQLVAGVWMITCLHALLHTALMARLSFCASNVIHHFFCDLNPLLQLSCSDISTNVLVIFTVGSLVVLTPFACILLSYVFISAAILRVSSPQGKQRAFSTCGSHLTVVALYYGTAIAVYFSPSSLHTPEKDTLSAIMYTMVTPLLNPFIYSLRNQDMQRALRSLLSRALGSQQELRER